MVRVGRRAVAPDRGGRRSSRRYGIRRQEPGEHPGEAMWSSRSVSRWRSGAGWKVI